MFGSLAPMPMPMPQMRLNSALGHGLQIMKMAQQMQRDQAGKPPQQGLLERLLNPPGPPAGTPTDLAAPGMNPNGSSAPMLPQFMQAGLLPRLMPQMFGGPGGPAPMGAVTPPPQIPANPLGGLY